MFYSGSLALPYQEFAESSVWKGNIVKCIYQSTNFRKKKNAEKQTQPIKCGQESKYAHDSVQLAAGSIQLEPGSLEIMGRSSQQHKNSAIFPRIMGLSHSYGLSIDYRSPLMQTTPKNLSLHSTEKKSNENSRQSKLKRREVFMLDVEHKAEEKHITPVIPIPNTSIQEAFTPHLDGNSSSQCEKKKYKKMSSQSQMKIQNVFSFDFQSYSEKKTLEKRSPKKSSLHSPLRSSLRSIGSLLSLNAERNFSHKYQSINNQPQR